MFCVECGNKLKEDSRFCSFCGTVREISENATIEEHHDILGEDGQDILREVHRNVLEEEISLEDALMDEGVIDKNLVSEVMEEKREQESGIGGSAGGADGSTDESAGVKPKKKKRTGLIVGIIIILLLAFGAVGFFVVRPIIQNHQQEQLDRSEAQRVMDRIDAINFEDLTVDSLPKLDEITEEYEALTSVQRALVQNRERLDEAYEIVEGLIDLEAATLVIEAIDEIDGALTYDDRSIARAREMYEDLTERQKALVDNIDRLEAWEALLEQLIEEHEDWILWEEGLASHAEYMQDTITRSLSGRVFASDDLDGILEFTSTSTVTVYDLITGVAFRDGDSMYVSIDLNFEILVTLISERRGFYEEEIYIIFDGEMTDVIVEIDEIIRDSGGNIIAMEIGGYKFLFIGSSIPEDLLYYREDPEISEDFEDSAFGIVPAGWLSGTSNKTYAGPGTYRITFYDAGVFIDTINEGHYSFRFTNGSWEIYLDGYWYPFTWQTYNGHPFGRIFVEDRTFVLVT